MSEKDESRRPWAALQQEEHGSYSDIVAWEDWMRVRLSGFSTNSEKACEWFENLRDSCEPDSIRLYAIMCEIADMKPTGANP